MISLISFLLGIGLLSAEGYLIASLLLGRNPRVLRISCSLPLGSLSNAMLFYLLHILRIPIALPGFIIGHLLIIVLCVVLLRLRFWNGIAELPFVPDGSRPWTRTQRCLFWLLLILTLLTAIAFSARAIILPTYFWDSFTNWHMRARTMLEMQDILFQGVQKPQYPILLHGLQMSVMMISGWKDNAANIATLLLSLSLLLGIGIMARARAGAAAGFIVPSLLIAVPFSMTHLQQGYADIHYTLLILLSAATLGAAISGGHRLNARLLLLSALLCGASAWTKLEGLWLGVIPWLAFIGLVTFVKKQEWKSCAAAACLLIFLSAPWPILLQFQNLPATSHGITFEWNLDAVPLIIKALYIEGSFGVHWYAITLLGLALLCTGRGAWTARRWITAPSSIWGLMVLGIIFGIFLVTIDAEWLQTQITFSRTMLLPTLLLTQGIALKMLEFKNTSAS